MRRPRTSTGRATGLALVLAAGPWLCATAATAASEGTETPTPDREATGEQNGTERDDERERVRFDDDIEVRERADDLVGLARTASEGSTGREDLRARPVQRSGEIVETVPGLIATQHSGDGKANQYFLRGFNLDHGTDFSIHVDGMPVNMPTHGHGQGYADLSFLVPEVVDRVRFTKGLTLASAGDFSAAGSARIDLVDRFESAFVELTAGSWSYGRAVAGGSASIGDGFLTAALELQRGDGPWERGNDLDKVNGMLRFASGDAARGWSLTAMGYDGSWLSTDQIPRRAVEQGLVDRFGLVDPGPRGSTRRTSLSGEWHTAGDRSATRVSGYAFDYDFSLVSNFTYFLDNPDRGDQFEQADERRVAGVAVDHRRATDSALGPLEWTLGIQTRFDDIENGLYRTEDLVRFGTVREDAIEQWSLGAHADVTVRWSDVVRSTIGLRFDSFDARVTSDLAINSGDASDTLVSPKLALVFGPWRSTEVYASWGRGFHSNDARGATIRVDPVSGDPVQRVRPLVRAESTEIGVRTAVVPGLQSTVTLHRLDLDSELVFVGDGGATEASRPSRRTGLEWTNAWRVSDAWIVDFDFAWVDAEFTDDDPAGNAIPGAVETVVTGGVRYEKDRWRTAVRLRAFDDIPLIEDRSVRAGATVVVNARVAFALTPRWEVALEGFNLLDRDDSDVEYFYASRLPGEPEDGIEDVHFHPVEKPSARIVASWRF